MLAKSAIKAATAALLALAVAQPADAWDLPSHAGEDQSSQRSTSSNAHSGSVPAAGLPGVTPMPSPAGAPMGVSGRVAPAVSTPSSQPILQQIRR